MTIVTIYRIFISLKLRMIVEAKDDSVAIDVNATILIIEVQLQRCRKQREWFSSYLDINKRKVSCCKVWRKADKNCFACFIFSDRRLKCLFAERHKFNVEASSNNVAMQFVFVILLSQSICLCSSNLLLTFSQKISFS